MLWSPRKPRMSGPILSPRSWRTWLYLAALTLVLSGCYRTPTPGTGTVTETLTGTVTEGWPGQPASLRLEAVTLASAKVLAEVPIAADGRFTLTLPPREALADALTPAERLCGSLEVAPGSLEVLYAEARVYASADPDARQLGVLGYQADAAGSLVSVILIYAGAAGRVEGSCRELGLDMDLELLEGWNQVLHAQRGGSTTLTTGTLPGGLSWRYYATW